MLIDIIATLIIAFALFKGFRKGLVVAVFSFVAFIIGLAAALKLSATVAEFIGNSTNISQRFLPALAFLAIFLITAFLIHIVAKMIESALKLGMLGWLNRLGGFLFFLLIYLFIFSIVLFYAVQLHLLPASTTNASALYPYIAPIAPKMMNVLSSIFPFLKNTFSDLLNFFENMSAK